MILSRLFKNPKYEPRMPEVDTTAHPESVFIDARNIGLGLKRSRRDSLNERHIALVTPGRLILQLACPRPGEKPPTVVADIRTRLPIEPPGIVVAIALNDPTLMTDIRNASKAIPFLDLLLNFGYAGHAVSIFEGHPTAYRTGVKGADMLLVDERMVPFLQQDWLDVARETMRTPIVDIWHEGGRWERICETR